jgi:delta-aminolevulinic acid dehydratase/porphobilinogen synthase
MKSSIGEALLVSNNLSASNELDELETAALARAAVRYLRPVMRNVTRTQRAGAEDIVTVSAKKIASVKFKLSKLG